MRPASLSILAASALWMLGADAQESTGGIPDELRCEECPWDAPVRIRRDKFTSPNATTIVTAEDMRSLGVISVADMVNQLPNGIGADSTDVPRSEDEAPFALDASIDEPRHLQNQSTAQAQSNDESTEASTDNNPPPTEGQAEE